MSQKKFTEEEQSLLRSNPNTYYVTANRISFTKEFKAQFYKDYMDGMLPRHILEKNDYPVEILGNRRIWGITSMIRDQYEKNGGFYDVPNTGRSKKPESLQGVQIFILLYMKQ